MKLSSFLNPHLIFIRHEAQTGHEALSFLIKEICSREETPITSLQLEEAFEKRGGFNHVLLAHGLAVPHLRLSAIRSISTAVLTLKTPIQTAQGPCRMILMILGPDTPTFEYLHLMAACARMSLLPGTIEQLSSCHSSHQLLTMLDEMGIIINRDLTVSDLMETVYPTAGPDTTLRILIRECGPDRVHLIPVIKADGTLLGQVTRQEILGAAFPEYARLQPNLAFMKTFEPFNRLFENEDLITAHAIMSPPDKTLTTASSIIEAAFFLWQNNLENACVTDGNGCLKGIFSFHSLMNWVLRS